MSLLLLPPASAQKRVAAPPASRQAPAGGKDVARTTAPATEWQAMLADRSAWLYKGSDITPDPAWHFGTLKNGLRFAVRKNGAPPGQVSVRVRIDAGSLNESDTERGFAHFMEHLSFRGSRYVADGEAKRTWQRMGTTFGSDTNASTGFVSTVYKLNLPGDYTRPAQIQANLDESLRILSGMMEAPTLTPAVIDSERPVVLAEQREQPGPQVRVGDVTRATFFAGQPLAERSPIGTIKTLGAATADSVKAFHDRWYRPERTVVVISGDIDPAVAERMVVTNFGSWKPVGPAPAEVDFGKPDPKAPMTAAVAEPSLPAVVQLAWLRPWKFNEDTVLFNQNRMVDSLAAQIISRRLENRARGGGSFLSAQVSLEDVARSANATFVNIVPLGKDWEAALRDVRAVIADARVTPPSQAEIDRELADIDAGNRTRVETARVEASAVQADSMVEALDIRETTTAAETSYKIFTDARAANFFTPARVLASTNKLFEADAERAVINTQTPDTTATAKLATLLKTDVQAGDAAKRTAQRKVDFSALPRLGAPGKVVSQKTLGATGILSELKVQDVSFANGVRAQVMQNDSETNRVYVRVRFGRGYNALPADRDTPIWAGEMALVQGGIGKLSQNDMEALVAGRRIGLDFDVDDDAFSYSALTSPTDLADQLRLIAARMAAPGWDPKPVERAKSVVTATLGSLSASPDGVLQRDLEGLLRADDPRWGTPTPAEIEATTPASFRKVWEPRLAAGPIEVQVYGDIATDKAVAAIAASIGALKPRAADAAPAPAVKFPAHNATPVVRTHDGPDNQAAAVIAWPTAGGLAQVADARTLDVLANVFTDRLFDRLRTEAGASYSPNVQSQWPTGLAGGGGRLVAIGQVPPEKVEFFFKLAREIAADLAARPVGADEYARVIGPIKQALLRQVNLNVFWMQQLAGASYDPARVAAVETYFDTVRNMSPEAIQAAAARYLDPNKDWTMAVLPKVVAARQGTGLAVAPGNSAR
ncbi:M16 family metallopeptidase [Sphingomonas aracearum]|uniref:M16 family metallopeptidase n=1 Tax=Sphingomonas aracearum TaxID=2283317 RepID=UPI0030B83811